jgi:hypothetical protein
VSPHIQMLRSGEIVTQANEPDRDRERRRKRCLWSLLREVEAELETAYFAEAQRLESLSDDQFDREMRAKGKGRSEVRSFDVWIAEVQLSELQRARERAGTTRRTRLTPRCQ